MNDVICWWSGGATSAVACKIAIDLYGIDNCRIIMIDTQNEDYDTYRFLSDCEKWYGKKIERISALKESGDCIYVDIGYDYENIQDVWIKHKSLNVATGAICSTKLKRSVRESWQEINDFKFQVFGFEFNKKEFNRSYNLKKNHTSANSIYPLLMMGYDKDDCIKIINDAGIQVPRMYNLGFRNNNCFKTGCVQGGIGYWQKMMVDFPDKFDAMADIEHKLTLLKGEPVTMLKDQSNEAKRIVDETGIKWKQFIFLKKHPLYPDVKCISDMKKLDVKPLFDCSGFGCSSDFIKNKTENEINFN